VFPYPVKEANFYITNICNLSCRNCITFSNLDVKKDYKWCDYKDKNTKWASLIIPEKVCIIGGEPFLNSDILNWVSGIHSLWPEHKNMSIATNGTLFKKNHYKDLAKKVLEKRIRLEVSVHHPDEYENILNSLLDILSDLSIPYIKEYTSVDVNDREYILASGITSIDMEESEDETKYIHAIDGYTLFTLSRKYIFQNNAVATIKTNNIQLHNTDPIKTHKDCCYKDFHYIFRGDLYKCHIPSVGRDLANDYIIDKRSLDLINNYIPCNPFNQKELILDFLSKIENPIPQCSVCSTGRKLDWALK